MLCAENMYVEMFMCDRDTIHPVTRHRTINTTLTCYDEVKCLDNVALNSQDALNGLLADLTACLVHFI